jgi:hypothetical protein
MQNFPKMTKGRLIALGIAAITVLVLAYLGGDAFWSLLGNLVGGS